MVDIRWEGRSQRSASQKWHKAHQRTRAPCTLRKPSGWDGGGDNLQPSTGDDYACQRPGHLSCSDLERAQNTGPTKSVPLWIIQEPEPEWLRPGKCMHPGPASDSSWHTNLESEQCRLGKHTCPNLGQTQCGWITVNTHQWYLFAVFLLPQSTTEQASLKKNDHHHTPCVRAEIRCWRDQQTEEAKINRRS